MQAREIFGRVIVTESGSPIPNLMVTLLQTDAGGSESSSLDLVAEQIFQPAMAHVRLGTAITDQQGAFELMLEVQPDDDRPDVVLLVMAPLTSVMAGSTPLPPQDRLLHFSKYPRRDIAHSEGFAISLSEQLLSMHRIGLPKKATGGLSVDPGTSAEAFKDAIERTFQQRDQLSAAVASALSPHATAAIGEDVAARAFASRLSALPLSFRQEAYILTPGLGPAEHDKELKALAEATREAGSKYLLSIPQKNIPLYISEGELIRLAGPDILVSDFAIEIPLENSCGIIRSATGGAGLTRMRTLRDILVRLRGPDDLGVEEPREPADHDDEHDPEGEDTHAATVAARIKALVEAQVRDVVLDESREVDLPESPLERVKLELKKAELAAGPADTTAYHDFHSLQIAYPNIWAEALDLDLRAKVTVAARVFRKVARDAGVEPDAVLTEEIREISHFVETLRGATDAIVETERKAIPEEVILLWPTIEAFWHLMTREEQRLFANWAVPDITFGVGGRESSATETWTAIFTYRYYGHRVESDSEGGGEHAALVEARRRYRMGAAYIERVNVTERAEPKDPDDEEGESSAPQISRLLRLLKEMAGMLTEPYSFDYYAENTANFGVLATYRQEWIPGNYQVGDLVATLPLAPGEKRAFEVTESRTISRSRKEVERAMWSRSGESTRTTRASTEIVRRAEAATNFSMTSQGSFSFGGFATIGGGSTFARNQSEHSQSVKNDFRKAVLRTSHEYRNETSLEMNSSSTIEQRSVTTGEATNTNNEVSCTYLYYQLERQYDVFERLHRLQPVILVAQKMPNPSEITESWLLRHEWILRRVILDDGLRPALDALHNSFASGELLVSVKRANWEAQLRIVQNLEGEQSQWLNLKRKLNQDLVQASYRKNVADAAQDAKGLLFDIGTAIGGDPFDLASGKLEAQRQMFEDNLKWVEEELQRSAEKLAAAQEGLDRATRIYSEAIELRTQQRTQIDQCRMHVKDNILYYMQAIWAHEPSDQRYFRLHNLKVFSPSSGNSTCRIRMSTSGDAALGIPGVPEPTVIVEACDPPSIDSLEEQPLHMVADLDALLGFKGNYMIFRMKECNFVTDFMMRDYVDSYFGIRDPDELSDFTTDELMEFRNEVPEELRPAVDELVVARLSKPRRDKEKIIVPTDQLYIEALVGSHTLLEPFKLAHRGYDADRAREELRRAGLENLRYAARLLAEEPMLGDPETETRVEVRGADDVNVDT